ncbi:MAG: hypothetical protein ABEH86_12985 [Haloarcula sp.]
MSLWLDLARVASAANVLLLLALGAVWARNYLRLHSKHTLGMFLFAAILCIENGFALYVYFLDPILSAWFSNQVPDPAWQAMVAFHALETAALVFLAWVTLD